MCVSPAMTSAITKASCPPSREGKGKEFNTARLMLSEAINPKGVEEGGSEGRGRGGEEERGMEWSEGRKGKERGDE